jgi:hypothetical protein
MPERRGASSSSTTDDPAAAARLEANPLLEPLAAAEHDSWARWMKYLLRTCQHHPDGSATIAAWLVEHWQRQVATPYAELSEAEKESDREEVRRILPLIEAYRGTRDG